MFYLKYKKKAITPIILKNYIKDLNGNFEYATGQSVSPDLWNLGNSRPVKKRGAKYDFLVNITNKLNELETIFNQYLISLDNKKEPFVKENAKAYLDTVFKRKVKQTNAPKYLFEFISIFVEEAPNKINRNTKKKFTKAKIIQYNKLCNKIAEFDKFRKKKTLLNNVDQKLYDDLFIYWSDEKKYSINYIGSLFKNLRNVLKIAEKDYKYIVCQEFKEKEFAVVQEDSISIALNEQEITSIFNYDFSKSPYLENCRDWAIIGFWTGLRISDLLQIDITPELKYIEIEPDKTSDYDIKVVIPIHHQVKHILIKRGMPHKISDVKFNLYVKEVCKQVGLTEFTKGSLMNPETKRKEVGMYEKYKLVSSHTCRRSFATNMYLMNFPTLSIMKITGHKTEKSFLKYIKVTPKEHADKLIEHWEQYYKNK